MATYETRNGLSLTLKKIQPGIIQKVMRSVNMPLVPKYKTRTAAGRVEEYPLDEVSAQENETDKRRWQSYAEQLQQAQLEQNDKMERAMFVMGVEPFEIPNDGWEEIVAVLDLDMPDSVLEKRVLWLSLQLDIEDKTGLLRAISEASGISEAAVKEAEASFRN